ncbi:hypothetical protein [Hyalangium versicolor]|uniref:hypothetical protein n=1 Tax=Hyalangium versicolor TaxID=2861190 RepID=UPI001CC9009E|nr:hypothetical protein [Hyalangium versicolor]
MPKTREAPQTRIIRNGTHGPDEPPASIDTLITLLQEHPVASWTTCRPLKKTPTATFFCGEFRNREHPFSILTTEPAVARRLTDAFTSNCERFHLEADEPRARRSRTGTKGGRRKR